MSSSIRAFLIVNLLLSLTLITSLSVVGNLFLEHQHMQKHVDYRLLKIANRLNSFFNQTLDTTSKSHRTVRLESSLKMTPNLMIALDTDFSLIQYQVYDQEGHIILRSSGAPKQSLIGFKDGFSNIEHGSTVWRVYTTTNQKHQYTIAVGESYAFLQALESRITQDSILIMLVTYPILAVIIWIIVGRGFHGVNRIANEIKKRDVKKLRAISTRSIPNEIVPFINELNSLFERLTESFEREKRFAADAAHELRTPLAILKTQAQVAQQAEDEKVKSRAIERFVKGIDRCTHIVQQLLTMSKMVPEASLNHSKLVDLESIAKEIISELVPKAMEKNIDIELICGKNIPSVRANETAMQILFRNLIDNAVRYIPCRSTIQVKLKKIPQHTRLIVQDNGPGIPESMRARVFERFFRMVGEETQGSGLGLGIVKKIVDLCEAKIELSAPPTGHGLIVCIDFPEREKNK